MRNTAYLALGNQIGLQRQMEVIANNLANVTTTGFKAERALFAELVTQRAANPDVRAGGRVSFAELSGAVRDLRDGSISATGNQLDMALSGSGYFVVESQGGPRYTRDGRFRVGSDGRLVTIDGMPVLDDRNRPIQLPSGETRVEVTRNGVISSAEGEHGRLRIARFSNEQALRSQGGGLYEADEEPEAADARTEVVQGAVESSNVQAVVEITVMIEIMRRYQSATKLIDGEDDRERKAIERLARAA